MLTHLGDKMNTYEKNDRIICIYWGISIGKKKKCHVYLKDVKIFQSESF